MTVEEFRRCVDAITDSAVSLGFDAFVYAVTYQFVKVGFETVGEVVRNSGRNSSSPSMEGQTDQFERIANAQQQKQRQLNAYGEWVSLRNLINDGLQTYDQVTIRLDTTQGMEDISFDAHFWSRDRLRAAAQTILDVELSSDTPEDEILWHVDEARGVLRQLEEIRQEAGASFVDSQQRLQLCLGVREAFLQRGWRQRRDGDCDFEDQDERNTLNLCLYSPANDEMRLAFNPDHTIGLRMNINGVHNRDLRRELAQALLSTLEQWGVTVNSIDFVN